MTCGVQRCWALRLLYFSWRELTIDVKVRAVVSSSTRTWRSSAFNLKSSTSYSRKVVAAMRDILSSSAPTPLIQQQISTTLSPKALTSCPGSLIKDISLSYSTIVWLEAEFVYWSFLITAKKSSGPVGSVPRVFLRISHNSIVTLAMMAIPLQRRLSVS